MVAHDCSPSTQEAEVRRAGKERQVQTVDGTALCGPGKAAVCRVKTERGGKVESGFSQLHWEHSQQKHFKSTGCRVTSQYCLVLLFADTNSPTTWISCITIKYIKYGDS